MRVLIITSGLSRIVRPVLDSQHEVIGIVESAARGFKEKTPLFKAISALKKIILPGNLTLNKFCTQNNIPYFFYSDQHEKLERYVQELRPDIIVVFSMSRLLRKNIIEIPKKGIINLHTSYLPDYRGPNPDFWQYVNFELNPGATVHYIDEGEDTGDIIYQDRIVIPKGIRSPDRLDKLVGKLGCHLLIKALDDIESGAAPQIAQPKDSPTVRARKVTVGEHKQIIDWNNWSTERIWNVLRGTELWLDALQQPKGLFSGQRWSIGDIEPLPNANQYITGKVYTEKGKTFVATNDSKILLSVNFKLRNMVKKWLF